MHVLNKCVILVKTVNRERALKYLPLNNINSFVETQAFSKEKNVSS